MDFMVEDGMLLMPRTNPDTGQTACGIVSLETIAAWGELLGAGSDVETVAAIMQARIPASSTGRPRVMRGPAPTSRWSMTRLRI